jgi:hypothetical protein
VFLTQKKFGIRQNIRKYVLLGVKQAKIGSQIPNAEFGAQNQYDHVIYSSIGNFIWTKKKYTVEGHKGENKPSVPTSRIWSPKSIWSCDISKDREFDIELEKCSVGGQKGENKPSELKKVPKFNTHQKVKFHDQHSKIASLFFTFKLRL